MCQEKRKSVNYLNLNEIRKFILILSNLSINNTTNLALLNAKKKKRKEKRVIYLFNVFQSYIKHFIIL